MVNGRIDKYQFEEGYCQAEKSSSDNNKDIFTFCYYDQDHLGNIRQVREANGSKGYVIQSMNYYPFGAEFCDNGTKNYTQKHKYNGKEFDNMHGLNSYDYGARQYNPVTARWDRIDRFCEKYYNISPYAYCANNPIRSVDINGDSIFIMDGKNKILYTKGGTYEGKSKFVAAAFKALNMIMKYGNETLMSLMSSEHSFNIKETSTNSRFEPEDENAAQAVTNDDPVSPFGCGGDVFWNSRNETSGPDMEGKNKRPSWIGLAHELGHADAADKGIANYWPYAPKSAWTQLRKVSYDEFHAMQYENLVRYNAGIPRRAAYTSVPENVDRGPMIDFMPSMPFPF